MMTVCVDPTGVALAIVCCTIRTDVALFHQGKQSGFQGSAEARIQG